MHVRSSSLQRHEQKIGNMQGQFMCSVTIFLQVLAATARNDL